MTAIETNTSIVENHSLQVGSVVAEQPVEVDSSSQKPPLKIHTFKFEGWPADCKFRREDIYENDGR